MKTNRIAVIILAGATLMLSSCVKEQFGYDTDITTLGDGEVAFRIGSVATKSGETPKSEVLDIATVNVVEGPTLFLKDEVTSLDDAYAAPATKGTPAFTENVAKLYGTFRTVALKGDGTTSAFQKDAGKNGVDFEKPEGESPYWHFNYMENMWEGDKLPTYYFMRMPSDMTDNGVTLDPDTPFNVTDGSIKFSYVSPVVEPSDSASASALQDILFTSLKRTEYGKNGETITFYHALTGVKFANFFDYDIHTGTFGKAETIIKGITISGLKNQGTCIVTPSKGEIDADGDNQIDKSAGAVKWENVTGSATFTQKIVYDFADYGAEGSKLKGTPLDDANNQASKKNLNDDDGSLTFWFIPQALSEDVTITIVFNVSLKTLDGQGHVTDRELTFENKKLTINLYEALAEGHREWKAGELHTFTLWPTAVKVAIEDEMNTAKTEKSNVVVKNKGNTWQYVRVNLVGNWVGKVVKASSGSSSELSDWTILMGYAHQTGIEETDPWNDKDGYSNYGTFTNLVPKSSTESPSVVNQWVRFDKYFYYTKAIEPNDAITQPIFEKYTLNTIPEFWIADVTGMRHLAQDVHLEMDLMVEAIEAPVNAEGKLIYPDGTVIPEGATDGYMKAWANALGVAVSDLDDLK